MKVTGFSGAITGPNGKALTPEEEAEWKKKRAAELLEKQKTAENGALNAWNAQYHKHKAHRRKL